jgi:hypothetical protein
MIELPRRSVTRFFVPMIDVLTLLFCIFLLMPMTGLVLPADEASPEAPGPEGSRKQELTELERRELQRLRRERQQWRDLEAMRRERRELEALIRRMRLDPQEVLEQNLALRILQIEPDGRLAYYDPRRPKDRLTELTRATIGEFLRMQQQAAGAKQVYYLILYPRPAEGIPVFPLRRQREEYDEWFRDVPHSYDVPFSTP